jgi:hypothetical protein
VIKIRSTKGKSGPDCFIGELHQHLKQNKHQSFSNSSKKLENETHLNGPFCVFLNHIIVVLGVHYDIYKSSCNDHS